MNTNAPASNSSSKAFSPDLEIVFLGGCGEFGSNMTAYIHQGRLFLVDCGLTFSEAHHLGIEFSIPNAFQFIERHGGVHSYLMTHGHEDHIGALPYYYRRFPAPIYCTRWTAALIRDKFTRNHRHSAELPLNIVEPGDQVTNGAIRFGWFHVNHSIPMACSLIVQTATNTVFHSGDFKFDASGVFDAPIDLNSLRQLGQRGIRMAIADSTNAPTPGACPGESSTLSTLHEVIKGARGLTVFSTFSSNWWRLKLVLEVAKSLGKHVLIAGQGISKTISLAQDILHDVPEVSFIKDAQQLDRFPRGDIIVLAGGCQGEHRAALSRIIRGEHSMVTLLPHDRVIFSSRVIPGNEKTVSDLISLCQKQQVDVITAKSHPGIHVSGHAHQEELDQLLDCLRPQYFVPVHGTFSHLQANGDIGRQNQHEPEVVAVQSGTSLKLSPDGELQVELLPPMERTFIDSWSMLPMDYETMRKRLKIGDSGLVVLSGVVDKTAGRWLQGPHFEYRGLPTPRGEALTRAEARLAEFATGKPLDELRAGANHAAYNDHLGTHLRRELAVYMIKKPVVISTVYVI